MYDRHHYSALVVVVVHGTHDVSRTTWHDGSLAKRYVRTLLEQGVRPGNIRVYRTRLVRPSLPSL